MLLDQIQGAGAWLAEAVSRYELCRVVQVFWGQNCLAVRARKPHIGVVAMTNIASLEPSKPQVSPDGALRIARLDAEQKYRDLSPYRIAIVLEDTHWRIDYELRNSNVQGGGPHYLIDAATGAILSKRYAQ
jgi:hypothetical protein